MRARSMLLGLLLTAAPLPGLGGDDHDRARRAWQAGEVRPLAGIVERVEADLGGRVVEVELEREGRRWVYELKLVTDDGRMAEVEVDATTGAVLQVERKER